MPSFADRLRGILIADPNRWRVLRHVRGLNVPDCWIGAGFVRNAVWDHLHGRQPSMARDDVDVLWFDPDRAGPSDDTALEAALRIVEPGLRWSVKNQARMHLRNGDTPYRSVFDAIRHWPETATAVAVRRTGSDELEVAAPFGLDDLFDMRLRPTPHFSGDRYRVFQARFEDKRWMDRWPLLQAAVDAPSHRPRSHRATLLPKPPAAM